MRSVNLRFEPSLEKGKGGREVARGETALIPIVRTPGSDWDLKQDSELVYRN